MLLAIILPSTLTTHASAKSRRGRKGALALSCTLKGATVRVDGKVVGTTPIKQLALNSGKHRVEVLKNGHRTFTQNVTIRAGRTVRLKANLPTQGRSKDGDGLELELIPPEGSTGNELELELELLPENTEPGSELELELIDADSNPNDLNIVPIAPAEIDATKGDNTLTALGPLKPWWMRWYSIAGAVTAVVVVIAAGVAINKPCKADYGFGGINYSCGRLREGYAGE